MTVGLITGSVGVLSEGIHSFLDLVSAGIAYFTIREAGKPADLEHPFGHGKIETLSSLFEALLLIVAAVIIVLEGIDHVQNPKPVQYQGLAIATIAISLLVSYFMYRHNWSAANETDSSAIRVNALHFLADVVASIGILVGLIILKLTGWLLIDAIMAFGVALYILAISAKQVWGALQELTDVKLPERELKIIHRVIKGYEGRIIEAHDLRTRKSGSTRHIDFHLVLCGELSVHQSHALCDEIEEKISRALPSSSVNIHVEPCEHENTRCLEDCEFHNLRKGQKKR